MWRDEYSERTPVVIYEEVDGSFPVFYRICPKCGRFVTPDERTKFGEYLKDDPNATCKKCGRIQMPFCTWAEHEDFEEWGELNA